MFKNSFTIYILLIVFLILTNESAKLFLGVDKLLFKSATEMLSAKQINEYIIFSNKWKWISYFFIPTYILIKTNIIATTIYIAIYFLSKNEVDYKFIWTSTLKAEYIFLSVPIFKIIWFLFFQPEYELTDIQNFYPLSALNITGYKNLETWFIYPFQILNLFEIFYIIYLGFQIGKITQTNTDYGLKIVSLSYGPILFIWVTAVMFFTLNYS